MKKLCILLLAILLCLPVCFPAFADMMGPQLIGYTATAKSDIPYFTWERDDPHAQSYLKQKGTIPAGTELIIDNEYQEDGELFLSVSNVPTRSETGEMVYVRARDVSNDHSDTSRVTAYKLSEPVRLRVMDPKGATLYAGPSLTYAKVGVIPQGTELTVDTLDQGSYESGEWMYITYGGKSGWTDCWLFSGKSCSMAELLPKGETGTVWVVKDNAVLKDRDDNDLITVPKGEKLTFDSFNREPYHMYYYMTYQGKTGYFSVDSDGYKNVIASNKNNRYVYTPTVIEAYSAPLYAYPDDKTPIGTVQYQAGDKLESEFLYYADAPEGQRGGVEWYYVEKDGQSGWIKTDYEKVKDYPEDYRNYPKDVQDLFSSGSAKEITVTVEQATTKPTSVPTPSEGRTTKTFDPQTPNTAVSQATDAEVLQETHADTSYLTDTDVSQTPESQTGETATEVIAVSGRPTSPTGVIGVCVAAAAVLALTAVVTLCLIRRKRSADQP